MSNKLIQPTQKAAELIKSVKHTNTIMIKKYRSPKFFSIFLILLPICLYIPCYADKQQENNSFQWTYSKDSLETMDGSLISLIAKANVSIVDRDKFSNNLFSIEHALRRLDEIVGVAIDTTVKSHNIADLLSVNKTNESIVEINKSVLKRITDLYDKYTQLFGMKVSELFIVVR